MNTVENTPRPTTGRSTSRRPRRWRTVTAVALLTALAAACSDDGDASDDTEAADTTDAPDTTAADTTDAPTTTEVPTTTAAPTTTTRPTLPPVTLPPRPTVDTDPESTDVDSPDDGEVLLDDDFEDDSNGWGPGDSEYTTGAIEDGAMRFRYVEDSLENPDDTVYGELYWPSALEGISADLSEVRMETSVRVGRGGVASVFCAVDPVDADDLSAYEFTLASSGTVGIVQYDRDGMPTVLARVPDIDAEEESDSTATLPEEPAFDYDPDETYALAGECRLSDEVAVLTLEVDGEVLVSVEDTDEPITHGIVGISFSQSRLVHDVEGFSPFDVVFEDFRATAPDGSAGDAATVVLDDEFDDDSTGWRPEQLDDPNLTGVIEDGALTFSQTTSVQEGLPEGQVALPALLSADIPDDDEDAFTDVRVDADVQVTLGGVAGITCGWDAEEDRFYAFTLSSAGSVAIRKLSDNFYDAPAMLPEDPDGEPAFDYDPDRTYRLSAECHLDEDGSQLTLFLDGEELLSYEDTDEAIPFGYVGVAVVESSRMTVDEGFRPFEVSYDRFTVTSLEEGGDLLDPAEGAVFESECIDETDDLTDDKGNPLPGEESFGTDLTGVFLNADGETLTVVWQLADAPPADVSETNPNGIRWTVTLFADDGEALTISAAQDGDELTATADSNLAAVETVDLEAFLVGELVMVDVPLDEVEVPAEFDWSASGELSLFQLDFCPTDFGQISVP